MQGISLQERESLGTREDLARRHASKHDGIVFTLERKVKLFR